MKPFSISKVHDALNYMKNAKHTGKIVINQPKSPFLCDKTYIITGGLGYIGLEIAKCLVNLGCRNIVLVSASSCATCILDFNNKAICGEV